MSDPGLFCAPGGSIPPMPAVLATLMTVTSGTPKRRVVRMFKDAPDLLETLFHMADAPYYCGQRPLETIAHVLDRIGLPSLRGLTLRAALEDVIYAAEHPLLQQLQRHGTTTAYITTVLARYAPLDREPAFCAALVQNIGLAIPLEAPQDTVTGDALWKAMRYGHEAISGLAAAAWGMPEPVQAIVRQHHQLGRGLRSNRSVAALVVADQLAERMGMGIDHPAHPRSDEASCALALDILELRADQLPVIQQEASDLLHLIA